MLPSRLAMLQTRLEILNVVQLSDYCRIVEP